MLDNYSSPLMSTHSTNINNCSNANIREARNRSGSITDGLVLLLPLNIDATVMITAIDIPTSYSIPTVHFLFNKKGTEI